MIYVVRKDNGKVIYSVDAWYVNAEEKAMDWVKENGYTRVDTLISPMGNMVIWVD